MRAFHFSLRQYELHQVQRVLSQSAYGHPQSGVKVYKNWNDQTFLNFSFQNNPVVDCSIVLWFDG
jgi:hypothetical protein